MKTPKRKIGDIGEEVAVKYLTQQGFQILERNFARKWGELDIIAKNKQEISFIEVKTLKKKSSQAFFPEQNVSWQKKRRLIRTAQTYLAQNHYPQDASWQIDVIAVELNWQTRRANLRHLKNAVWG